MPSPIGHAIAGAAVAWAVAPRNQKLVPICAALAVAPDLDLLIPQGHRMVTHSVAAIAAVTILTIAVTGKVTGRVAWRVVLACVAAYASHLLLDWLAADPTPPRGLQILWPFTNAWYISNMDWFRGTARQDVFTLQSMRINITAVAQEVLLLGPIAWGVWSVRVKTLTGFATEMTGRHHAPQ